MERTLIYEEEDNQDGKHIQIKPEQFLRIQFASLVVSTSRDVQGEEIKGPRQTQNTHRHSFMESKKTSMVNTCTVCIQAINLEQILRIKFVFVLMCIKRWSLRAMFKVRKSRAWQTQNTQRNVDGEREDRDGKHVQTQLKRTKFASLPIVQS